MNEKTKTLIINVNGMKLKGVRDLLEELGETDRDKAGSAVCGFSSPS